MAALTPVGPVRLVVGQAEALADGEREARDALRVAARVRVFAVDGCGEWSTFVGGGTGHWTPGPSVTGLAPTAIAARDATC